MDETAAILLDGQPAPAERTPFVYIQFFLSNQIQRVEREYPVVIDTLQNIGGVAEVLLFIFVYMMMLHHDIIMDLFMLNNAVLMNHFNVNDKKIRKNQVTDFRSQPSKLEHLPYTYSELVHLKFFSCCKRKDERTKKYKQHMEVVVDRMDIRNIITCEGNISALSNIFMLPYQVKIVSHYKKRQDDETKIAYTIPIGTAIKELK